MEFSVIIKLRCFMKLKFAKLCFLASSKVITILCF